VDKLPHSLSFLAARDAVEESRRSLSALKAGRYAVFLMPWLPLLLACLFFTLTPVMYGLWRGLSMPSGRPEHLRAPEGGSVLLCLGDSITHGHIGASWVEVLRARFASQGRLVANGGVNGQQAWNVGQRLDAALTCQPDMAVLLIGSNDVMAAERRDRAASYKKQNKLPQTPDLPWSIGELRALVPRLRAAVPRVALCTLPPLGDDPRHPICELVAEYNAVVRELALEHDCVLLDIYAALTPLLSSQGLPYRGSPAYVARVVVKVILAHYLLGRSWDSIADAAGYGATAEGIHLTEVAAHRVAELVAKFVENAPSA